MARRSQCSDAGDNPLDPNYLPPHYREDYRLAIDALVEEDVDGYYKFLQFVDVVDFLSPSEIDYIQHSIQIPKQSSHPEQRYLDTSGDSSSDTYWPLHSDLDAPGLDLGWPQTHHFIGPTEVTTLVNPAAPDMPSIKEQARRLIKNAQMVIAVVMDMFTDVDIFADILNAAMRNVAVYLLLDEANVQHFVNMVNKCRVNLQSLQYLRVRTVTGIRYHCRTGKSFKGQMLDRFILTDCRAVLSGNYSFMWSYEKLHRCMAHLFLGQLVSTFDEEFRILFAQSEPLVIENMEDMTILPKHPLPGERTRLRDIRKYHTMDTGQEERMRQPFEENMDWRMNQLKRQETFHGPLDIYNRYPSPQSRLDPQSRLEPQFDQGPPRIMDSLTHKRHSFAEGAGAGRYNLPYQQQGLPDVEQPGRPYYRGQQHLPPRDEPDYGGYGQMDKFWNQDFQQEEPYPEPGYPRDTEPHEGFDPVLNYLSSSRNQEIDQGSDKLIPGPDLPYSTTHPRRQNINQAYACQTSPTPSNTTEKKSKQDHGSDRKDPTVRKGLRNWRISSYLSAYDSSGEQEGLPMGQGSTVDPFDDMPHPSQQPTPPPPAALDLAVSKIPNVREFKVPALPRASQMPAFAKTGRDLSKRFPNEMPPQASLVVPEPKVITPTPSESSSTTDGEKQEEPEQREPITSTLRRDDPFRRKFNAGAVQRSSRLRGSLLFSSLDQNQDNTEQEDDKTKAETDQTKLPFVSQVLAQRRTGTREPFEWRNYIKSTDNAKAEEGSNKQDEKDSESKLESLKGSQEIAKSKDDKALPSQIEPKTEQQPPPPMQQPLLSEPFVDMNDPDQRFSFFKELAAKRRAAKAAEEAKLKQETQAKDKKDGEKKEEQQPQKDVSKTSDKSKEDSKKIDPLIDKIDKVESGDKKVSPDKEEPNKALKTQKDVVSTTVEKSKEESKKTGVGSKMDSGVKSQPTATQSSEKIVTKVATDTEKIEAKQGQASRPTSTETLTQEKRTSRVTDAAKSADKQEKPPEANVAAAQANVGKVTEETQPATTTDATSKDPPLKTSRSVPDFAKANMSDLLSSLPSARMSERSSQEANKDTAPKPRLWSPSLNRREPLKAFGEKPKSVSSVAKIEEATEEASPSSVTNVKPQTGDKTETKQKEDSKVETATSATESKESAKVKSQNLPAISKNTQPQQDGKGTSPLLKKSPALPIIPETSSAIPDKAKTENSSAKSTTSAIKVKEDSKDSTHSQSITPEQTKAEEKTEVKVKEAIDKEASVKSSASDQSEKPTQAAVIAQQTNQDKASDVKDSENPSPSQSVASVEQPSKDQPKTELKQSLSQTEQEKCSDEQVNTSVKPVQPEKLAEKPNVVDQGVTKEPCPKEKADKLAPTIEKSSGETTPSGKDRAKEAGQLGSIEKTSSVTQEEVEQTADSLVITPISKGAEKSSSASPEGPVPFSSEEAKQRSAATCSEDFTQLEPHSDTSSPASFATAVEFMSSEDSDMFSPAKGDSQHLFKSGNGESSISDMSDFETPNSEISMSPMPSAVDMDDTFEDNVSIAETVIEAASRRKSEAIEERSVDGEDSEKTCEDGKLGEKTAKSEEDVSSDTQFEVSVTTKEPSVCPASSQVKQETKMAEKATEVMTESSIKEKSDPANEGSRDIQSEASKDVKTQDLTSQSETKRQLSKEKTADPTSPATSEERKGTKVEDKTAEITTKDGSKSTKSEKESIDVKSLEPSVSTINIEAESKPLSIETGTSPATDITKEAKTVAKVSEISSKDSAVGKEPTPEGSKRDAKTRIVSSRFLSEPSTASVKTKASTVTPKVTQEVTVVEKTDEIKEKSQSNGETEIASIMEAKEKKGQNLETRESETKPVETDTNTKISKVEAKMVDKTTENKSKEAPSASENVVSEKDDKGDSKTEVSSSASSAKQSQTGPAKQETKTTDKAGEITAKDTADSIEKCSNDSQADISKETKSKTEISSPATSEDTTVLDKEPKVIKEMSTDDQSEQTSKDTSVNSKDLEQNTNPEPAKTNETAPPSAQPKQQPKPSPSRYLSSTANVISSSNLRDDTKILLEKISAQSQSRSESAAAKEAPVTDDEKEGEADKNAKRKKENELRSSLGQQKSSQEREKVLERIQTMRKDRKVYSRFEL